MPELSASVYSQKQCDILVKLDSVISHNGINLHINEFLEIAPQSIVALDVEHDESGTFVGCGICICGSNDVYYYSDIHVLSSLSLSAVSIIGHNGVSDMEMLRFWGINVSDENLIWDTMLMGHLIDSSLKAYGLKDMAKRELGISYPSYDDIVGKRDLKAERVTLDKQPIELVSKYNLCDVFVTMKLFEKQRKGLTI